MKLPNATATSSISDAVSRQPHIRSPDEVTTSVRPLPTPLVWRPSDSKRRFGVKSEPLGVLRRPHPSERSCRHAGPVRNLTLSNYRPDQMVPAPAGCVRQQSGRAPPAGYAMTDV